MLQAGQWSSTIAWRDIEVWKERGEEDFGVLASCTVENDVMTGRNFGSKDIQRVAISQKGFVQWSRGLLTLRLNVFLPITKTQSVLGFPGDLYNSIRVRPESHRRRREVTTVGPVMKWQLGIPVQVLKPSAANVWDCSWLCSWIVRGPDTRHTQGEHLDFEHVISLRYLMCSTFNQTPVTGCSGKHRPGASVSRSGMHRAAWVYETMSMSLFSYRGIFEFHWMLHYHQPFQSVGFFPVRHAYLPWQLSSPLFPELFRWFKKLFTRISTHKSSIIFHRCIAHLQSMSILPMFQGHSFNESPPYWGSSCCGVPLGFTRWTGHNSRVSMKQNPRDLPELLNHLPLSISNNIYRIYTFHRKSCAKFIGILGETPCSADAGKLDGYGHCLGRPFRSGPVTGPKLK